MKVYIDAVALGFLEGVEIDYKTQGVNRSLVFKNVFANTDGAGTYPRGVGENPFAGILGSDDSTVELAAHAAQQLGLSHNPSEVAQPGTPQGSGARVPVTGRLPGTLSLTERSAQTAAATDRRPALPVA